MIAEIVSIGDEILIGQIVNTNAVFIAKELNKIGIEVGQITSFVFRIHIPNASLNYSAHMALKHVCWTQSRQSKVRNLGHPVLDQ